MALTAFLRPVVVLLALAPLASSGTLTVGPAGSGAQFTQIQAAIDAALDDDVILVKPGTYQPIVVSKPLRILGDGTGVVRISKNGPTAVTIHDIGAGAELVLSAVEVVATGSDSDPDSVILLQNCPGTVVLQDVTVPDILVFEAGVQVQSCARALLLNSQIHASFETGAVEAHDSELWIANSDIAGLFTLGFLFFGAAPGVAVENSTLHVWRSEILGGGGDVLTSPKLGGPGGAGIEARGSTVDLFGGPDSQVTGGMGPFDGGVLFPYAGGPGLALLQNSHALIQADIPIEGGFNGHFQGQAPAIRVDGTSSFTRPSKVFPTLVSNAQQVQLGSTFALTLTGNAGGYQVLFLSLRTGPTTILHGVDGFGLLDRSTMVKVASEVLPPSGATSLSLHVPNNIALLGSTLFFQAAERLAPHPFLRSIGGPSAVNPYAIGNPVLVTITR